VWLDHRQSLPSPDDEFLDADQCAVRMSSESTRCRLKES
jgi:hypothetical protein